MHLLKEFFHLCILFFSLVRHKLYLYSTFWLTRATFEEIPCSFVKSGNTVRACTYFIIEMSDKVHYNGRFIKQKVLNKRLEAVAAMAEAKKRRKVY